MSSLTNILILLKKNWIASVSILILFVCVVVSLIRSHKYVVLDSELVDVSVQRTRMLQNLKNGVGLEEDIEKLSALVSDAESHLFNSKDLASNYNYFFQVERETGVKLDGLRQYAVEAKKTAKKRRSRKAKQVYAQIGYDMNAIGSFSEIIHFLGTLEQGPAPYNLTSFSLSETGNEYQDLSLSVSFKILSTK